MPPEPIARPSRRLTVPLRMRATVAFGLVSLLLAGTLAGVTYGAVRRWILDGRESAAIRQAYTSARLVRNRLRADDTDIPSLLSGLQLTSTGDVLLEREGLWYASSVGADRSSISTSLRDPVQAGHSAHQVVQTPGGPVLAIGIPISELQAQLYVLESLDDVDATLGALATALALGAAIAATVGAGTGTVVSGRVLQPLREIAGVAHEIAGGDHDVRLAETGDPDLRALTASFNDMVEQLEERARREARFASDVSHDLRGPLTALAAAVAVVHRRRDELPAEVSTAVDALEEQVESFNRLVVDLLEISRFEAGTVSIDTREVDAVELVRAVLAEAERHVPVRCDPDYRPRLDVDPRRMQRVLVNLLENAERYAGGATAIHVTPAGAGTVAIAVDDEGPGVPPEMRQAIFSRYERGRAEHDAAMPKGTGLGLALAAQHVKLHGGTIRAEAAPGGGARFVVELPEVRR